MVKVTLSETYDLSTQVGKLSLVGIHTPTEALLKAQYPGLLMNSKYFRYLSCDVTMACASLLSADPLQIGVEAGSIAPQDMFNPILYKAVSNDSMNLLELRLAGELSGGNVVGPSLIADNENVTVADNTDVYYGLLQSGDHWRKAMPQAGLQMRKLVPLVYSKYYNYGEQHYKYADSFYGDRVVDGADTTVVVNAVGFRGNAVPMPKINCTSLASGGTTTWPGFDNSGVNNAQNALQEKLPPVYVGVIILPPAKLNKLYYRLNVRWTVEFTEVRPLTDITDFAGLASFGNIAYASDYVTQSANMTTTANLVDVQDADLTKVMEGS